MTIDSSNIPENYSNNEFPDEILQCIFRKLIPSQIYVVRNILQAIYECQLVCKEWSKAAQEALYTNVLLNLKAAAFTKTIEESAELGVFVTNIQFEDGFASLGEENISFYSSITNMHRDTLTDIQLTVDNPTNDLLVEHLKEFKFLKRLQISKYELSSLDYLNKMINDCSTVY